MKKAIFLILILASFSLMSAFGQEKPVLKNKDIRKAIKSVQDGKTDKLKITIQSTTDKTNTNGQVESIEQTKTYEAVKNKDEVTLNETSSQSTITTSDGTTTTVAAPLKKPSAWKFTGVFGVNIGQTQLVNWAEGGDNTFTGNAYANLFLYYNKKNLSWTNQLNTEFGMTYIDNQNFPWRKSSDNFYFSTMLGYQFAKSWYAAIQGDFRTQYANGYNYKDNARTQISSGLSPAYTNISIGINWKPNDRYFVYLSPIASRITIVKDSIFRTDFGVLPDKTTDMQWGIYLKAGCNFEIVKNLKLITSLDLYTPYSKQFGNIDVNWDLMLSYQFLKVLTVSLNTSLKYYDKVLITLPDGHKGPRVQFKEVLGLGIGYSF